jgi:hypothetical protein
MFSLENLDGSRDHEGEILIMTSANQMCISLTWDRNRFGWNAKMGVGVNKYSQLTTTEKGLKRHKSVLKISQSFEPFCCFGIVIGSQQRK